MKTETSPTIRREDYCAPTHRIRAVHLDFDLNPASTRVYATLDMETAGHPAPLVLHGETLKLIGLKIDGRTLKTNEYTVTDETLAIHATPAKYILETAVEIAPEKNTSLSGLYISDGIFCTQCEAEGFRRITYFLDRPDTMAVYTTRMTADRTLYPVLLSNGNMTASGHLPGGRHFAEWRDPFPKPSYLFALVAGDLARVGGDYVTGSGRRITLGIYVDRGNEDKCAYGLDALKRSMRWDEERFGLEYDLDIFNIVAVSAFNFGAMENKGLNVFNDKVLLARSDIATDYDYELIEGIVAHEYFHNWTGNRVTCRDWFQLCLKEGLTVFRDQEFSADMRSAAVKRISEVRLLRQRQFKEDSGPLAHPVRPDAYQTIDNFYTSTVYEKGAEVCRMIQTIVGRDGFRKGMDLYFERHDGTAATVEDFAKSFEDACGADLTQFRLWWAQAGTPTVKAHGAYDANAKTYTLHLSQHLAPTPGQPVKLPMHMPIRLGLLDPEGHDMALELEGADAHPAKERVLHLTQASQTFRFRNVARKPVPSIGRGFSAPAHFQVSMSPEERAFLMAKDGDAFNRWDAGQAYAGEILIAMTDAAKAGQPLKGDEAFIEAYGAVFRDARKDMAFSALMLSLPSEGELAQSMSDVDPEAIHTARMHLIDTLATRHRHAFEELYHGLNSNEPYEPDAAQSGRRALRNTCLRYLTAKDNAAARALAFGHFQAAGNMTDVMAALQALADLDGHERQDALDSFYEKWKDLPLVVDKWMGVQAMSCRPGTQKAVEALLSHKAFSMTNPNRVRSLIGAFANSNPLHFHAKDGAGYRFVADRIVELDAINPQVAARLSGAFESFRRYDGPRREQALLALTKIAQTPNLSRNTSEMVGKTIAG